jgi:hypothetical protein
MPDGSAGIHTVFASQDLPQDTLGAADQTATAIQNVLYGARAFFREPRAQFIGGWRTRQRKKSCNLKLSFYNSISLIVQRSLIQIGENSVMILNSIEREFLSRLSFESWKSPAVFDHQLVDRLVANHYVTAEPQGGGRYNEITDLGRAAIGPVNAAEAGGSGGARFVGNC